MNAAGGRRRRRRRPGQTMRDQVAPPAGNGANGTNGNGTARWVAEGGVMPTTTTMTTPRPRDRPVHPDKDGQKIAIVVQRHGAEINGGAELHARYVAERLARHATVEVLTTCAKDYITWKNEWPAGEETLNRITVRRFRVCARETGRLRLAIGLRV